MSQKTSKTWCLRLLPVLLFFISFITYYYSNTILQSYASTMKSVNSSKSLCGGWLTQKRWESLNFNISRQTQLFLTLKDFFWRGHLSNLALPYGIKGSEALLMKILARVPNFQVPADIENLECRTCVVVGNSFAIKNSSLGNIINKYDVVIRLNDAPVRGYKEDVGNKTTMRFFYPESASANPGLHNEPGTLLVLVPFKQQDLQWLKNILYNEKRVRKGFWRPPPQVWVGDVDKIRVLDPYFLHQTADRLLRNHQNPKKNQARMHSNITLMFIPLPPEKHELVLSSLIWLAVLTVCCPLPPPSLTKAPWACVQTMHRPLQSCVICPCAGDHMRLLHTECQLCPILGC